jgi:catechol 2,3-dioxygenase-like lactoylglutathione lyase family enzyme
LDVNYIRCVNGFPESIMPMDALLLKLDGLHHAAFRCRDAEQTRWFYEDVLGLPAAAGVVLDIVPGTGAHNPYFHIFFELGDGNYIAFFDAPGDANPAWFERKDSFDMHVAIEAATESDMLAMQTRIRSFGIKCAGPIDHHFVRSVYMYDPNGIQVEIAVRTAMHDTIMSREKDALPESLRQWTKRTRAAKETKFGAAALDLRGTTTQP